MTIDISKILPGDRVTLVPLEVDRFSPLGIMVSLPGGVLYSIAPNQIAAHHPAPREFQVGDDVRDVAQLRGTILALAEGYALVRWPQGNVTAKRTNSLTLVEAGE